ncbi:hypothetical protein ACFQ22_02125 [Lentilactobacillus raoultii]|uniref:Uncharacterized protein n=1 Tax=Lentilactobacillus raoultii TaxID=1987503 RepID=A0ABW3PLR2_9LACO|nr:hypothetical protein [Lentilactobacillus raoultii]
MKETNFDKNKLYWRNVLMRKRWLWLLEIAGVTAGVVAFNSLNNVEAAIWHSGMPKAVKGTWESKPKNGNYHTFFYLWNSPTAGVYTVSRSYFDNHWMWGNERNGIFGKTHYKVINRHTYMIKAKNKDLSTGYVKETVYSHKLKMKYYGEKHGYDAFTMSFHR